MDTILKKHSEEESDMNTMLRWSPTRQFHFHHNLDALWPGFVNGATDEVAHRAPTWLPAAEGRIDDGAFG